MRVRAVKTKSGTSGSRVKTASRRVDRTVVAIDPGLGGTGIAIFAERELRAVDVFYTMTRDKSRPWSERALLIAETVAGWVEMRVHSHPIIVSEFPMKMERASGLAAQRYATMRLAFLVGAIAANLRHGEFVPVTPIQWKGQLPKGVVQRRIQDRLGQETCRKLGIRSHAWDAVGIGLWYMGRILYAPGE